MGWRPTGSGGSATQYAAVIRAITDQSISAATLTEVDFGATISDEGSVADLANNGFTVPSGAGGIWLVNAVISYEDTVGADTRISYAVNDVTTHPFAVRLLETQANFGQKAGAVRPLDLSVGDTVTVDIYFQQAGNTRGGASLSGVDTWAAMWRA